MGSDLDGAQARSDELRHFRKGNPGKPMERDHLPLVLREPSESEPNLFGSFELLMVARRHTRVVSPVEI